MMLLKSMNEMKEQLNSMKCESKGPDLPIPKEINFFTNNDDNNGVEEDDANSTLSGMTNMSNFTLQCDFNGDEFNKDKCFHDIDQDSCIHFKRMWEKR